MRYELEQGNTEKLVLQQLFKTAPGRAIPNKIANAPSLRFGLELFYVAFMDLVHCRDHMSGGPITWFTIQQYAVANDFDEDQTEALHFYISEMDDIYLTHMKSKSKSKGVNNK